MGINVRFDARTRMFYKTKDGATYIKLPPDIIDPSAVAEAIAFSITRTAT